MGNKEKYKSQLNDVTCAKYYIFINNTMKHKSVQIL